MKKKYMAIVLGMSVALASVTGCGGQTEQTQTTVETTAEADASEETEAQADVIYGEVASVTDTSVTIQVGTMKEGGAPEKPDDANGADSAPDGMPDDQPSMLELDGTEQTIAVTADTIITRQQMGGPQGGAPGEAGENRAPEKPDDANTPTDGNGADGSAADKESAAETGTGVTDAAPEKPDGAGSMDKTDGEGAAGASFHWAAAWVSPAVGRMRSRTAMQHCRIILRIQSFRGRQSTLREQMKMQFWYQMVRRSALTTARLPGHPRTAQAATVQAFTVSGRQCL